MRVVIPQQWCTWALGPELKRQWCLPTAPMLVSSADIMQWAETPPSAPSFLLLSEFPSAIQMEWNEGREDFHYHWGHNVALNILKTQIRLFFFFFFPSLDARERQNQKYPIVQNQTTGVLVRCAAFCFPERCRNQETKAWRLGCSSSLWVLCPRAGLTHQAGWASCAQSRQRRPLQSTGLCCGVSLASRHRAAFSPQLQGSSTPDVSLHRRDPDLRSATEKDTKNKHM